MITERSILRCPEPRGPGSLGGRLGALTPHLWLGRGVVEVVGDPGQGVRDSHQRPLHRCRRESDAGR